MRKPGFTLQLSLFHSAILAGYLHSTPSSVSHPQNENKNLPKYLYSSDEKRSPQNTNQAMPLVCADCLSVCFFFFFFHKRHNSLSLVGPRAVVSITVSASLLFCSWHQPCEPSPDSGEDCALSGFFVCALCGGKGAGAFPGAFLPSPPNPCPSPAAEQVALLLPRACTGSHAQEPRESEGRFGSSSFYV